MSRVRPQRIQLKAQVVMLLLLIILLFDTTWSLWAQTDSYDLTWNSIDGGRQVSSGVYMVTGVIGQPDAGESTGGDYHMHGGFLHPLTAAPTPASDSIYLPLIYR